MNEKFKICVILPMKIAFGSAISIANNIIRYCKLLIVHCDFSYFSGSCKFLNFSVYLGIR